MVLTFIRNQGWFYFSGIEKLMRGYANGYIIKYIYICITLVQARSLEYLFFCLENLIQNSRTRIINKHGCFIFNAILQKKIEYM